MADTAKKILKQFKAQELTPIANEMVLPNHSGNHGYAKAKSHTLETDEATDRPIYTAKNTRSATAVMRFGTGEISPAPPAAPTTVEGFISSNISKTDTVVNLDDTSAYGIYFYFLPKWTGSPYFGFNYAEPQANPVTTLYYPFTVDMAKKGAIHLGATTDGFGSAVEGQTVTIEARENDDVELVLQWNTSSTQTSDMMQFQDDAANVLSRFSPQGYLKTSGQKRVSTQFDKTNDATLANVTGLSVTVSAGKSYFFRAKLFVDADAVGGHKYAVAGSATATAIKYQINSISNTANTFVINSRQTAMAGSAGQAGATTVFTEIEGLITVNAQGTLTIQFAQNAATPATTSSVLTGSHFIVEEIA